MFARIMESTKDDGEGETGAAAVGGAGEGRGKVFARIMEPTTDPSSSRPSRNKASGGGGGGGAGSGRRRRRKDDAPGTTTTKPANANARMPHYFVQLVEWDLADPKTPTPEEYACRVASEFGLSFPEAMDLESDIRRQLDGFCKSSASRFFRAPLAIGDPYGADRPISHYGPPESRWGPSWGDVAGGGGSVGDDLGGAPPPRAAGGTAARYRPPAAVKPDRGEIRVVPKDRIPVPNPGGDAHADEVLRRARSLSERIVSDRVSGGEATLTHVVNEVCHICHNRKASGLTFHCGRHTYCDFHCAVSR